jgi:hypothetical protein
VVLHSLPSRSKERREDEQYRIRRPSQASTRALPDYESVSRSSPDPPCRSMTVIERQRWKNSCETGSQTHQEFLRIPSRPVGSPSSRSSHMNCADGRLFHSLGRGRGCHARRRLEHPGDRRRGHRVAAPRGIDVALHDCRRAFAKPAVEGGAQFEQIQLSPGHASIHTTKRYLGVEQDLTDVPCDRLGLRLS